jgi:4-hydroxy-tetrahydrodipicolinate synthase
LHLRREVALCVIQDWRQALADRVLIAGVGPSRYDFLGKDPTSSTIVMASLAAEKGADALLVYPPVWLKNHEQRDAQIVEHHVRIAELGLPLVLFYLYEAAGGISYDPLVLSDLLSLPNVIGIKVATLDSVMTYQDIARRVEQSHPDKLLITGEDRFFGYSLLQGAHAALIGMGAVCTDLQVQLINAHFSGDAHRFLALSDMIDRLAQVLFVQPMEGYIGRILVALSQLEIIPTGAFNDPFGPQLSSYEIEEIRSVVNALTLASVS